MATSIKSFLLIAVLLFITADLIIERGGLSEPIWALPPSLTSGPDRTT